MVYTDKVRRFYEITSYLPFYFRLKISLAAKEAQDGTHYPCSFLHSLNAFKGETQDKSPIFAFIGDTGTVTARIIYKSGVSRGYRGQTVGSGYVCSLIVRGILKRVLAPYISPEVEFIMLPPKLYFNMFSVKFSAVGLFMLLPIYEPLSIRLPPP